MPAYSLRIVLLEDDPLQAEWIAEEVIWKSFRDAEIRYIDSEFAFLEGAKNGSLLGWKPQFALLDLLTRFYSPGDLDNLTIEPDFSNLPDPKLAGIRCLGEISKLSPCTKCAVMTTLDTTKIARTHPKVRFIQKGNDELAEELIKFLNL
jgi:hypothetical protein